MLELRLLMVSVAATCQLNNIRLDFVRHASRLGIPYFDMTKKEWDAEMRSIDELTS